MWAKVAWNPIGFPSSMPDTQIRRLFQQECKGAWVRKQSNRHQMGNIHFDKFLLIIFFLDKAPTNSTGYFYQYLFCMPRRDDCLNIIDIACVWSYWNIHMLLFASARYIFASTYADQCTFRPSITYHLCRWEVTTQLLNHNWNHATNTCIMHEFPSFSRRRAIQLQLWT